MPAPRVISSPSSAAIAAPLVSYIRQRSIASITSHGSFSIALSGGSLINILSAGFKTPSAEGIEFGKWDVFFADERCVTYTDPENTFGLWKSTLEAVGVKRVHAIDEKLINDPHAAAIAYTTEHLQPTLGSRLSSNGFPSIDLIVLGIGPDGHTASLFPEHALLQEDRVWTASITDSPKPPPGRITLTVPVIRAAGAVAVVGAGGGKKDVVVHSLTTTPSSALPLSLVRPTNGEFVWFLDDAASAGLKERGWALETGEEAKA